MRGVEQIILAEETQSRFRDMDLIPGTSYSYTVDALGVDGVAIRRFTLTARTASGPAELIMADGVPSDIQRARSLTLFGWTPDPRYDTCPKWLHDSFWAFGPDDKTYPTWHPPVYEFADGSNCRFGHEHGQDQRQSALYTVAGPIPFGYVNEQLSPFDAAFQRNEDHVGHKVALFNALPAVDRDTGEPLDCDVYFKLHQGTHSTDAFRNNSHERFLNYRCSNGFEVRWKGLQSFGEVNTFTQEINNILPRSEIATAGAIPANAPRGGDRRIIPTATTIAITAAPTQQFTDDLPDQCDNCRPSNGLRAYIPTWNRETWQGGPGYNLFSNNTGTGSRSFGFRGGPYWNLANSARFYDPNGDPNPANSATYRLGRQLSSYCFTPGGIAYETLDCQLARARGVTASDWESPLSPFKGTLRFNEFNFVSLFNPSPENQRQYTDPYGDLKALESVIGNISRVRTSMLPIRQYYSVTNREVHILAANWAGSRNCGGRTGAGACWTDFNWYQLRNGTIVDAGIHVPN